MFKPRSPWVVGSFLWLFVQFAWVGCVDAKAGFPVIFVPGLTGDETTWQAFGKTLRQDGWKFGGCPWLDTISGKVINYICLSDSPDPLFLSKGDFYRMRFSSDNQNLPFDQQAQELQSVISKVLALTGKSQVILVGHSMGGLAARRYLQFHFQPDNVLKLITVGTPHGGAELAVMCQQIPNFCSLLGIAPKSTAIDELRPNSPDMLDLNNPITFPLPKQVRYTSIIGTGTKLILYGGDGDGIVTTAAQNLSSAGTTANLRHTAISVPIQDQSVCDKGYYFLLNETHTCEPTDTVVWTKLLQELQVNSCNYYASGAPVPAGYGVPWNVFSSKRELLLKTYCSPKNTDIVIGNNSSQMLVYHRGYQWNGTQWNQVELQCAGKELSTDWCAGEAAGEIATSSPWYLGYTCTLIGSQYKCGCQDSACTQSSWQIQGAKR